MLILCYALPQISLVWAENVDVRDDAHVHIQDGVVYCDARTFQQEAYILTVLGSGSPLTVQWQFEVFQQRNFWLDKRVAVVQLGRQVIPDLVTKRWLMRDLSVGVIRYTSDIDEAMRFLTEMAHVAVIDMSLLETEADYALEVTFFIHEGEHEKEGWWSSLTDWGESMGAVKLKLPHEGGDGE